MPYTLRIHFDGLCLFVPQLASGNLPDRMHVLMPLVKPMDPTHAMHRHAPVLGFETAHLYNGTAVSSGIHTQVLLRDWTLEREGAGATLDLCPEIVDLRSVTQKDIDLDHLDKDRKGKVAARVTLGAGAMAAVSKGVCWKWGASQVRRLAHRVVWTIPDLAPPLDLKLTGIHGNDGKTLTLPPLYPLPDVVTGDQIINLRVSHVPHGDLPLDPPDQQDEPAPDFAPGHFREFYQLFPGPVSARVPRFASQEGPCLPDGSAGCRQITERGGSPYTCMVAGVWPPVQ